MTSKILPVILSGGAGTRLWPVSRSGRPKQFHALQGEAPLLVETLKRLDSARAEAPLILTGEAQRFLVAHALADWGYKDARIILEPEARNTAPALAVAALWAKTNLAAETVLAALPADHVISQVETFRGVIDQAAELAGQGHIVAFGIEPDRAHSGFGYIKAGEAIAGAVAGRQVERFTEKPDAETAARFLEEGGYTWNSGIFVFSAATMLAELERHAPEVLEAAASALASAEEDLDFLRLDRAAFSAAPSISIDYAVLEKTERAAVIPVTMGWNDIGSWQALWEIGQKDDADNVVIGDAVSLESRGSYLYSDGPLIAALGLEDVAIVATDDVVLALPRERAEQVKDLVEALRAQGREELSFHKAVHRPWGSYRQVSSGRRFQVKEIVVRPGAELSLQFHHHRAEHWVVVEGTAQVTRNNEVILLSENESLYIPIGAHHRLGNPGKLPLRLIEVQSGSYLGEDDIVRLDDTYGRKDTPPDNA